MMKNKIAAAIISLTALCAMIPANVFAAEQTVEAGESGNACEVTASATVTDQELKDLGLNVVVSFPTEVALALDKDSKEFKGTGNIYAYGIMDSGKQLAVAIDSENAAYGKVKYRDTAGGAASTSANNFFASVSEKMIKVSNSVDGVGQLDEVTFTAPETLQNYLDKSADSEIGTYAKLSVNIGSLIPTSGKGIYFTNVPFRISIQ